MKRTVVIVITLLAILSTTTATSAQTTQTTSQTATIDEDITQSPLPMTEVNIGRGLQNAGKAFTITGVTSMAIGASMIIRYLRSDRHHSQQDPMYDVPMLPVFGALFGGVGAVISLIGLPIYWGGKYVAKKYGTQLVPLGREQQGWMGLIDLGAGLDCMGAAHAVYGYNFNKHIFVGAGVGYEGPAYDDFNYPKNIPIYANVRLQLGKRRVVPYMGIRGGYDIAHREPYVGVDAGVRLQSHKSDGVWWGATSICLGSDFVYPFMGIRISRSL